MAFESSVTSVSIFRLMRPSESTTGVKATPTPNSLKMTERPPWLSTTGIGILAAGQELRRFTRHRGQVRLGQRAYEAVALERLDGVCEMQLLPPVLQKPPELPGVAEGVGLPGPRCSCTCCALAHAEADARCSAEPGVGSAAETGAVVSGKVLSVSMRWRSCPS